MIQELKVSNFLSFKEEVTFSFEATKDTTFQEYQVVEVAPGVRLLRFAMLYGANASGKSNLLKAFAFLYEFWFDVKKDVTEKINRVPFKLDKDTPQRPSKFSLKFYVNGVRYWYVLELDDAKVHTEELYRYNSAQPSLLFERKFENNVSVISFNPSAVKVSALAKEELNIKCLANMSVFAARNQVNVSLPKIDDAKDWLKKHMANIVEPLSPLFMYAERRMQEDTNLKSHLLDFIKEADFNISDVKIQQEKQDVPQEVLELILKSETFPADEKERLLKEKNFMQLKTDFEHTVVNARGTEKYYLMDTLESDGTRRITGVQAAIYTAMQKASFLSIDELESSLHPGLILFILKKFLENKGNQAQLLISTHYDPLLNEVGSLFRKDAIWFTDKNEAGATQLYSLVEFSGLNRLASIQKAYRQGRFGAIPRINL